jgi:hypothetical protein
MSFVILDRGKKSSKFWQVIVIYGRFVGFKEQLGFFKFCYELALANHAKKKEFKKSQFFTKMCIFWAKHKIFKLDVDNFPTIQIFFSLCAKVIEVFKFAKKKGPPSEFRKRYFFKPP